MNEFSASNTSTFADLRLSQIRYLLDILGKVETRTVANIKRLFSEHEQNFTSTLHFLSEINFINISDNVLFESKLYKKIKLAGSTVALEQHLLNRILESNTSYREEIFKYLMLFEIADDQPFYKPGAEQRSEYSNVRNILIELGVVHFNNIDNSYYISPTFTPIIVEINRKYKSFSKSSLQSKLSIQDELGFAAELAILAYEKNRIGPMHESSVIHIANSNVAAGYDIESVTILAEEQTVPRLIEVKAVPQDSYRFYWSSNERETAKKFGAWYYLYLLPVKSNNEFYLDDLLIINNPSQFFFTSNHEWDIESDILKFSLKIEA